MRLLGALLGLVILAGSLALLAVILLGLFDVAFRPTFRRLALRNINRRRGEAVLVVLGSLLGTAIISSSYVVGDTISGAISDSARTGLGPIDETVRVTDGASIDEVERAVTTPAIAGVDGTLRAESAGAVIATTAENRKAVPIAALVELDFDRARALGTDPRITGLADAGPTPTGDEAVLSSRMAERLGIHAGDPIEVFAYGNAKVLRVRAVLDEVGLVGYTPVRPSQFSSSRPESVFVAPGTIDGLAAEVLDSPGASTGAAAALPIHEVLVSNTGGVFDSGTDATRIVDELTARVDAIEGAQVVSLKTDLLDGAKTAGDSFSQLFGAIGYFSVAAGILLLVNLFVMLSEERKSELGMLRAIGLKRNHLVRSFVIEGGAYSVIAAIVGAVAAIGVSWVIILVAAGIFSRGNDSLAFPLVVKPASLAVGASIGFVISMATVAGTSARIARLNIIAAIRDLQEVPHARQRTISLVLGLVGILVFGLAFLGSWSSSNPNGVLALPCLALFCLIPVLGRVLPRKPVIVGVSLGVLFWAIGVFSFAGDKVGRVGVNVFVIQGILLVAAGVSLFAQADRLWGSLAKAVSASGKGLSARLGLAYPLARKFRTSMLLAMFSLVIFTMAFISVLQGIFGNQAPQFTDELRAGFDLFVDSSQGNPATLDQIRAVPGVEAVAPFTRGGALVTTPKRPEGGLATFTGFEASFLSVGTPHLDTRADRFATDADAFDAVLHDPSLIIVNQQFGRARQGAGGPPEANLKPGDVITARNPISDTTTSLTVVGVLGVDLGSGSFVSADFVRALTGPRSVQNRHYVKVAAGADPEQVATRINGALITNGASAQTFSSAINDLLATQLAFFSLLRGYLGLGLVIGIAGLGVVMVRAVRERRRQIGMLRAMGFSAGIVRRSFIVEAAFVAAQGIVLGLGLGMITSYNLLTNSDSFGGQDLPFSWPWGVLALIAGIPFVASLLATAVPAAQAARIKPAVALRIAD